MWADQSIETCDDWVIPYLGDLLGTNLVTNLDAQAQRLDVAKTIHYRRRKGTVEILEELAQDVTGWTAHVVEAFRRLGRTRHGLDPAIGPAAYPQASAADVAQLARIEGLTGPLTGGAAGGFADLRSPHGALLANTAFDESFHAADVRTGRGAVGHFAIPNLLVFLWRLTSFPVVGGTPVAVAGFPGQYVFDPTGRQAPLFLPAPPVPDDFAGSWTPAREWQVPGPLTDSLERAITAAGTASPPGPDAGVPARYGLGEGWQLTSIWPETGRFAAAAAASPAGPLTVDYHYGFSAMIGAGPYDRGLLGNPPAVVGSERVVAGGTGLDTALAAAGPAGTITVGDSLTYPALADVGSTADPIVSLLVRAGPGTRPVLRPAPGAGRAPAVGLHRRRRRPARPGRPHRFRLRYRPARLVRHGADHRVHHRPRHRRGGLAAARDGGRRRLPGPVPDLRRGRSGRPGSGRGDQPAGRGPLHPRPRPHALRGIGRDADDHRQHHPGPARDQRHRLHPRGCLRPGPAGPGTRGR